MKEIDSEDTFFMEIMSKSKLDVPSKNFDDDVMKLIEMRLSKKVSRMRDIVLSWIFFILGSTFGIIATILISKLKETFWGIPSDKITILFLIIFSFLVTTQLDSLIDFYKIKKMKTKRRYSAFGARD
jgi:hypothetical protein